MFWFYIYLGGCLISAIIVTVMIHVDKYQHLQTHPLDRYDESENYTFYFAIFFWPIIAPITGIALTIWLIYIGVGKLVFYLLNKFSNQSVVASSQNIQNDPVEVVNLGGNVIATVIPQNKTIEKKSNKKIKTLVKSQAEVKTKEELF